MKCVHRQYSRNIHVLLSSAACAAMLSFSAPDVHARGIFDNATAVPAIEVNLDAIYTAKKNRIAAAKAAEEAQIALEKQHQLDVEQAITDASEAAQLEASRLAENAQDEVEQEIVADEPPARLPIIVKKVEAPIAPIYQQKTLVPEVERPTEEASNRTVASMFRDLFYDEDDVGAVEEKASENISNQDVISNGNQAETVEDVEDVAPFKIQEKIAIPADILVNDLDEPVTTVIAEADEEESENSTLSLWLDDEPDVNEVNITNEVVEVEEPSFFDRFFKSVSGDVEEKREDIVIENAAPSKQQADESTDILASADNSISNSGRELLSDAEEETLVKTDLDIAAVPASENVETIVAAVPDAITPSLPEGTQVILPNKIDKNEDVFIVTPTPTPRPFVSQLIEEELVEVAVAENVAEASKTYDNLATNAPTNDVVTGVEVISSLEEKQIPSPNEYASINDLNIDNPVVETDVKSEVVAVGSVNENNANIDEVADEAVRGVEALDVAEQAVLEISQPAIPAPTEIIERDLQQEELVAAPVTVDAEPTDKGFFAKAKGWFGNENTDEVSVAQLAVDAPSEPLSGANEVDVVAMPPASLPEPVDISAAQEKLDDLTPAIEARLAQADVVNDDDREAPLDLFPVPVVEAENIPLEVASLAPVEAASIITPPNYVMPDDAILSLAFLPEQTSLTSGDVNEVKEVVSLVKEDERKRFKIKSYASPLNERAGSARRLSLQRAIAIRSVMVDNGIEGIRINVQALGDSTELGAMDRVEILVEEE